MSDDRKRGVVGLGDVDALFADRVAEARTIPAARALWGETTPETAREVMARQNLERLCSQALVLGGVEQALLVATHAPADSMHRHAADKVLSLRLVPPPPPPASAPV